VLTITEGEAALRVGNTGRARAVLLLVEEGEHFDRADGRLLRGGLLIAEGDFKRALEAVEPCLGQAADGAADGVTLQEQISGLLIAAAAQRRLGLADEAAGLLEQALTLAEPEGAYRAFLTRGPRSLGDDRADRADQPARMLRRADPERFDARAPARQGTDAVSVPLTDSERRYSLSPVAHDQRGDLPGTVPVHQHGQDAPALGLPEAGRQLRREAIAAAAAWAPVAPAGIWPASGLRHRGLGMWRIWKANTATAGRSPTADPHHPEQDVQRDQGQASRPGKGEAQCR
jgi:tetratricopeptide (TPR) repeat protein